MEQELSLEENRAMSCKAATSAEMSVWPGLRHPSRSQSYKGGFEGKSFSEMVVLRHQVEVCQKSEKREIKLNEIGG